ncbi:NS7d protein [Wigeon coronavirus HKU20]|uniref:NS7d protein n=1 Tax=Wigeon coronavirus HKU20 TaxID=1159908 RepID=H9BR33_9NIDO|nr:NS7d protein [Wigeon coronavirus HKU20]AFD29242.1 NS7d protein [Wigeon coronavirus HKU20]
MAQIVRTPLEASTQAMTTALGYSQCNCDWQESKKYLNLLCVCLTLSIITVSFIFQRHVCVAFVGQT